MELNQSQASDTNFSQKLHKESRRFGHSSNGNIIQIQNGFKEQSTFASSKKYLAVLTGNFSVNHINMRKRLYSL